MWLDATTSVATVHFPWRSKVRRQKKNRMYTATLSPILTGIIVCLERDSVTKVDQSFNLFTGLLSSGSPLLFVPGRLLVRISLSS